MQNYLYLETKSFSFQEGMWMARKGKDWGGLCQKLCKVVLSDRTIQIQMHFFVSLRRKQYMRFENSALQQAAAKKWWAANVS